MRGCVLRPFSSFPRPGGGGGGGGREGAGDPARHRPSSPAASRCLWLPPAVSVSLCVPERDVEGEIDGCDFTAGPSQMAVQRAEAAVDAEEKAEEVRRIIVGTVRPQQF